MGEMKERMLRGELYLAGDAELAADHARAQELLERYNATPHSAQDERDRVLRELLGKVGEGVVVKPPFRCDYGRHVAIEARTFVNYGCVMLDVAPIRLGSACQLATNVQLLTATHPIDPEPLPRHLIFLMRTKMKRSVTGSAVAKTPTPQSILPRRNVYR